jgi:ribosome assembly protein YihI (activator of Der GTPase)
MSTYLNKEDCKIFLKKIMATAVKKLNELNEIKNEEKDEEYNKLLKELEALNKIMESTTSYLDLVL